MHRNILSSQPRVTRIKINWDDSETSTKPEEPNQVVNEETMDSMAGTSEPTTNGLAASIGFSENSSQSAMEVM